MPVFISRVFRSPPAVVAFLSPILVLVGNKLLAAAVVGLAVAIIFWRRPADWRPILPFALILGLVAVWGVVSAAWSIAPAQSIERAARFAGIVICGLIVCRAAGIPEKIDRVALGFGLFGGLALAAALLLAALAWQAFFGKSVFSALNQKPFATLAAVLLVPAAGALLSKGWRWSAAVLVGLLPALFVWADSLAALAATGIGAVVFAVVWLGRRPAAYAVSGVAVAALVILPMLAAWSDSPSRLQARGVQIRESTSHRIVIWDFVGQRILQRPFLGWGLGTARNVPGAGDNPLDRPKYRDFLISSGIWRQTTLRNIPLHPHNATLHAFLELGVPGLVLYLGVCVMCFRSVIRGLSGRLEMAVGMATVAVTVTVGQVSFSLWQSWWIAAQFMIAAILLALYRSEI